MSLIPTLLAALAPRARAANNANARSPRKSRHISSSKQGSSANAACRRARRNDAARRAFGNVGIVTEDVRAVWGWTAVEQFVQDVRYAVRTMRRSPGFAFTAILSLAMGIGVNAAMFSLADALLFRPLAIRAPGDVAVVRSTSPDRAFDGVSYPDFKDFRDKSQSFDGADRSPPRDAVHREDRGRRAADADGHEGEPRLLPDARRRARARPRVPARRSRRAGPRCRRGPESHVLDERVRRRSARRSAGPSRSATRPSPSSASRRGGSPAWIRSSSRSCTCPRR